MSDEWITASSSRSKTASSSLSSSSSSRSAARGGSRSSSSSSTSRRKQVPAAVAAAKAGAEGGEAGGEDAATVAREQHVQVFDMAYYERKGLLAHGSVRQLGDGDSAVIFNVLPPELSETAFDTLMQELEFGDMYNRGKAVPRGVCLQGTVRQDGSGVFPMYRHPVDDQPPLQHWTANTSVMKDAVERCLVERKLPAQTLNHALIQLYKDGRDHIFEHADKTLDIERGTSVINLSFGATRVMTLETKDHSRKQLVTLPHNSIFVLGWETNKKWKHSVRIDKRSPAVKRIDEMRNDGMRISLTLRSISTFCRPRDGRLFGQGAKAKTEEELEKKLSGELPLTEDDAEDEFSQAKRMLSAFSHENQWDKFDWDKAYGRGFDITSFAALRDHESWS